ncbi:MAG TPA: hypothetical protein VFK48_02285 [Usitatibacter sp.]|nr:hypothetical protein [Usitatibacter sp.]
MKGRSARGAAFGFALLAFAAGSLWLRMAFPLTAAGPGWYDDYLFVRLGSYLNERRWLGDFDELTLAKGAAFPALLAINQALGLPLALTQHLVYLGASLALACTLGRVFRDRAVALLAFALLAANPLFWYAEVGGRVVRENFYVSLTLLLMALAIRAFLLARAEDPRQDLRAKRPLLGALGAVAGVFWLTREEGVWIAPAIAVLAAAGLWRVVRGTAPRGARDAAAAAAGYVLIPALAFALVVGAVNARNYEKYGVFANNEFRSRDFQAAYGAISRIAHARWRPYVVFPRDAREHAYGASAAARELRPYFEGRGGEFWRRVGCEQTQTAPCPEILSGWFMWALRDAVKEAGHYRDAREARAFYRRLAREVNAACEGRLIPCGPRRDSLVPPWRPAYAEGWWEATRAVFVTLVTLGPLEPGVKPSIGPDDRLALFERVTHGPIAPADCTPQPGSAKACAPDPARLAIARALADAQSHAATIAIPASVAAWLALAAVAALRRRWHAGHVVVAALAAAVASRVLLLGFLEATSIPSNNMLYLSPAAPLALLFPLCVAVLAWREFRPAEAP